MSGSESTDVCSATDGSFEIELVWSEKVLTVAADQSALEVLIAAGVPVEPGCQTGGCGMCATEYVDGVVAHKDACLNALDRQRYFCPCVSRGITRLVVPL